MATDRTGPETSPLGRVIASRRRELGMSRSDLVDASGLSYPYVSQLETGRRTPSRRSVARLAEALELDAGLLDSVITTEDDDRAAGSRPRSGRDWQTNPAWSPPARAASADRSGAPVGAALSMSSTPDAPPDRDTVQRAVTALLRDLPAGERLEVLHAVQREVLDDL